MIVISTLILQGVFVNAGWSLSQVLPIQLFSTGLDGCNAGQGGHAYQMGSVVRDALRVEVGARCIRD